MTSLILKYAVTALIVVLASELAKRSGRLGAFVGALPTVAIIVMTWLYFETKDVSKLAEYARYTFWYVLPGLPAFLLFDYLLRQDQKMSIAVSAALACAGLCFAITVLIARKYGIELLPES